MKSTRSRRSTFPTSTPRMVQNSLAMMLRTHYKAPSIIIDKNLNSVTIRDTPSAVNLAEKLIRSWDKSKGEVVIDLEIMEVSRLKLQKLGIDLGQNIVERALQRDTTTYSHGRLVRPERASTSPRPRTSSSACPRSFLQFLETDADTKIIAQPRLRGARLRGHQVHGRPEGPGPPDDLHPVRRRRGQPAAHRQLQLAGRRHRHQDQAPHPLREGSHPRAGDQDHLPRRDGVSPTSRSSRPAK